MPDILTWHDRYRIGHPTIDGNHRRLFEMLQSVDCGRSTMDAAQILNRLIDDLLHYANDHFPCEELLMSQVDYPNRDFHVRTHRAFITQVKSIDRSGAAATHGIDFLTDYLRRWILGHIVISDKKFGSFLTQIPSFNAAE